MPNLDALRAGGSLVDVQSHADIAGATTWPSFATGTTPAVHGIYNEWAWDPTSMTVRRPDLAAITPFWASLAEKGVSVGTLDVPFTPLVGLKTGFEVAEWGAHDRMSGRLEFGPSDIAAAIETRPRHPYGRHLPRSENPDDTAAIARIGTTAMAGIQQRGALSRDLMRLRRTQLNIIVFTELHDAGHHLWHTVEPESEFYAASGHRGDAVSPSLADLYSAVDREIGLLVAEAGADSSVLVLSLSGMRAGLGWPQLLPPMLEQHGLLTPAGIAGVRRMSVSGVVAAAKRAAPTWARTWYHRHAAVETQIRLARPTMVVPHDWSRTQAFQVMQDHSGYCRLNVAGRERDGIVPVQEYLLLRDRIMEIADGYRADDGRVMVSHVVVPDDTNDAFGTVMPDLVLHWTREAELPPLPRVGGKLTATLATGRTGHHQATGFCVAAGPAAAALVDPMPTVGFAGLVRAFFG
jgi:predicted AlkP superfamily phosphohydrolase/phosphomutase